MDEPLLKPTVTTQGIPVRRHCQVNDGGVAGASGLRVGRHGADGGGSRRAAHRRWPVKMRAKAGWTMLIDARTRRTPTRSLPFEHHYPIHLLPLRVRPLQGVSEDATVSAQCVSRSHAFLAVFHPDEVDNRWSWPRHRYGVVSGVSSIDSAEEAAALRHGCLFQRRAIAPLQRNGQHEVVAVFRDCESGSQRQWLRIRAFRRTPSYGGCENYSSAHIQARAIARADPNS